MAAQRRTLESYRWSPLGLQQGTDQVRCVGGQGKSHPKGLKETLPGAQTGPGTVLVPTSQPEKNSGFTRHGVECPEMSCLSGGQYQPQTQQCFSPTQQIKKARLKRIKMFPVIQLHPPKKKKNQEYLQEYKNNKQQGKFHNISHQRLQKYAKKQKNTIHQNQFRAGTDVGISRQGC